MNPWMAALGAGLQSAGQQAMQYLLRDMERKEQEKERTRLQKLQDDAVGRANRQFDQQVRQWAFSQGLSPYEEVEAPIKRAEQVGSAFSSFRGAELPGGMGVMLGGAGDALSELAKKSRGQLGRGRTIDLEMADGKSTRYFQPYEKTKEGMEERERTRGVKALENAGFSTEEANAIYSAPENLRSAILERIRPQAKGQPQEIVGPDGRVRFVQPPALKPGESWDSGLTQRTPPAAGSTPYNWTLSTDDTTGTRVLVDPRTGQTRPVMGPGGEPMRDISDEVKKQARAFGTMRANLNMLRDLVKQHGLEYAPGEAKAAMESALSQAQVAWKTYAELGALSGPDMGLVINAIGDPTSLNAMGGGAKGVMSKLDTALKALDNEERLFTEMYKVPVPGSSQTAPGGAQLSPQEQAIYNAAKLEGKSDPEIMAFLQKLRSGSR